MIFESLVNELQPADEVVMVMVMALSNCSCIYQRVQNNSWHCPHQIYSSTSTLDETLYLTALHRLVMFALALFFKNNLLMADRLMHPRCIFVW